eukprot:4629961-Pyramimonas_sp.AAC.1
MNTWAEVEGFRQPNTVADTDNQDRPCHNLADQARRVKERRPVPFSRPVSSVVQFSVFSHCSPLVVTKSTSRILRSAKRGGGVYPEREPIAEGEAVSTQSENQSQEGRQYLPSVRTNRDRRMHTGGAIQRAGGGRAAASGQRGLTSVVPDGKHSVPSGGAGLALLCHQRGHCRPHHRRRPGHAPKVQGHPRLARESYLVLYTRVTLESNKF